MSKRETSSDAQGWKRGEKGFGKQQHDRSKYTHSDYKKELLKPTRGDKAVGQIASVGDGGRLRQDGY